MSEPATSQVTEATPSVDGSALTARFQRKRWSPTRKAMDAMKPGDTLKVPLSQYFNAHSSAIRLGDAYHDRKWVVSKNDRLVTVQCLPNSRN